MCVVCGKSIFFNKIVVTMTRHARNCTAGAVYTYHEKRKDAAASGYGTDAQRVGKDSVKDFDCCCLTLQPCRDPVITLVQFYNKMYNNDESIKI